MHDMRRHEFEPAPVLRAEQLGIAHDDRVAPCVEVVVPVCNEAATIDNRIATLHAYLTERFPFSWRITIIDNASTDGTWFHAARLARDTTAVRVHRLDRKGRGLALRSAWMASDAAVVAYMDVDLSTDLDALLPLVAPLVSGHSDLAIGSRCSPGSAVTRGPKRELISRSYNSILRGAFETRVHDAQCGFKALRADVARALLPLVEDNGWFFDTELLLLAEHNGLRIHEVPVDWVDDPDSRVHIRRTAIDDLRGTLRMLRRFRAGHGQTDVAPRTHPETRNALCPSRRDARVDGRGLVGRERRPPHAGWPAPMRAIPNPLVQRLARCLSVSVGTTLLSAASLIALSLGAGVPAGTSNVIAVCCGIVPSYFANRHWVWGKTGRSDLLREVAPFWILSLAGLVVSTLAVSWVASVTAGSTSTARAVLLPLANLSVFVALWVVQFVVLDRVLFARPTPEKEPVR